VVREGDAYFLLEMDQPSPARVDGSYWAHLAGLYPDARIEPADAFPFEHTRHALDAAWQHDRARTLVLVTLDPTYSAELRTGACRAAEGLLAKEDVLQALRCRLLSRVAPNEADFDGGRRLAESAGAKNVGALLAEVSAARETIALVRSVWDRALVSHAPGKAWAGATGVMDRLGAFARLVSAAVAGLSSGAKGEFTTWFVQQAVPALKGVEVPQPLLLLQTWLAGVVAGTGVKVAERKIADLVIDTAGVDDDDSRSSKPKPSVRSGDESKARVDRQKEAILESLARNRPDLVRRYVTELLKHHEMDGRNDLAAKSLCDLAKQAERRGKLNFAGEWLEEAIARAPDDPVPWNQLIALRRRQRKTDELLVWSTRLLERFPDDAFAHTGRAEVLKALGRLDGALKAYDAILARFPDDVVAHTGRAEVLKALGRLDEARKAYEGARRMAPDNDFGRHGLAFVLARMQRFEEAEHLLRDDHPPQTPPEWFRYHGLGLIALRSGDVDRALTIFEHGAGDCPIPEQRARFESALALARLRKGQNKLAANELAARPAPSDALGQVTRNLILAHAFAAGGDLAKAKEQLEVPTAIRLALVVDLRKLLALRYGLEGKPANDTQELDQNILDLALRHGLEGQPANDAQDLDRNILDTEIELLATG